MRVDFNPGHRYLLAEGVLHRDIKFDNLRLGDPDAPIGDRGTLVDLDMAIWVDREEHEMCRGERSV